MYNVELCEDKNGTFILLYHFIKKTRKTPQKETDQAKRKLKDYKERRKNNGNKF